MSRPLYDGEYRSCHTGGTGERETKASTSSTCFSMLAQVESPVNSIGVCGIKTHSPRSTLIGVWPSGLRWFGPLSVPR